MSESSRRVERLVTSHVNGAEAQKRIQTLLRTPAGPKSVEAEVVSAPKIRIRVRFEPKPDLTKIQIHQFFANVPGGKW